MQDIQQQINAELDKFDRLTAEARTILNNLSERLEQGYPPSSAVNSGLYASLKGLRQLYESVCSMIAAESVSSELLQQELSSKELREITASLNETLEKARDDVKRFIRIRSSTEKFNDYIKPVQEKAEKLLQRLETQNLSGSAKKSALNEAEKYRKFVAMLDTKLTEGNISNTEELVKIFPPMMVVGLTANYYYVEGSETHSSDKTDDTEDEDDDPHSELAGENHADVETDEEEDENVVVDDGTVLYARNPVKTKKPGAKAFRDEILKPALFTGFDKKQEIMDVLNIFSHYGILTLEQIVRIRIYYEAYSITDDIERENFFYNNKPDDKERIASIRNTLEWLERKKAVSVFPTGNENENENFYCLTKWISGSFEKEEVRKRFKGLTAGRFLVGEDSELSLFKANNTVVRNSFILEYLDGCANFRKREDLAAVLNNVKCSFYDTTLLVIWKHQEYTCHLFPSVAEVKKFIARHGMEDDIIAVTFESSDTVNEILSRIDEKYRNRIFLLVDEEDELRRGLDEYEGPGDDDNIDFDKEFDFAVDSPEDADDEAESQLGFDFGNEPETPKPHAKSLSNSGLKSALEALTAKLIGKFNGTGSTVNTENVIESSEPTTAEPEPPVEIEPDTHEITVTEKESHAEFEPETHEVTAVETDLSVEIPTDDDGLADDIRALLAENDNGDSEIPYPSVVTALLTAKAASSIPGTFAKCSALSAKINLAVPIINGDFEFTGANLASAFPDNLSGDVIGESLMLSAYLNCMMFPEMPYSDFELKRRTDELSGEYDLFFPSLREARKVFTRIYEFHRRYSEFPAGFIESLCENASDDETDNLARVRADAEGLLSVPSFNKDMKVLPFFAREFFGPSSDITMCVKAVYDDDKSSAARVREFLEKYYDPNEKVTAEKLRDIIDSKWAEVWRERSAMPGRTRPLISNLRTSIIRAAHVRMNVMSRWLALSDSTSANYDTEALTKARDEILTAVDEAMPKLSGKSIVLMTLERIRRKLTCSPEPEHFAVLLTNGIIPLDADNSPVLGSNDVKYYEPLRNVMRFRKAKRLSLEEAESKILYDVNSPMFENLHQLELIRKILRKDADLGSDAERAREAAEKDTEDFRLKVMTDYAFGRISEDDKETFNALINEYSFIMELGDFGCWREFLGALRLQAEDITASIKARIIAEINSCIDAYANETGNTECPAELSEAKRLAEEGSLNAAESFLNRFESARAAGITSDETRTEYPEINGFANFMASFGELYGECDKPKNKEKTLRSLGHSYIADNPPEEWSSLTRKPVDGQTAIIDNWPSALGTATPEQVRALVNGLGFSVSGDDDSVKRNGANSDFSSMEIFTVKMKRNDGRNCTHPIAKFGTELETLSVVILYGSGNPEKIVNSVMDMELGTAILIMDYHVSLPARNQFAKAFRTNGKQDRYFLLIDRVLALFLTLQDSGKRLSLLLQCTLPYTSCIPFTKGSGYVAPEMFYGRERELADIRSAEGLSLVYGGRQLGKTSLLKRAETLEHQPDKLRFAVYIDLSVNGLNESFADGYNDAEFAANIISSINAKIPGLLETAGTTLQSVCDNIGVLIAERKAESLMLMFDEADTLFDSVRDENYESLSPLFKLRNSTGNRFRFVLAGLHNVLSWQFGRAMCIRPLPPFEARRLLLEPLEYLGFKIDSERHLETILTSTNYYPGVIQYFGYTLLEKFTERCINSGSDELSPPFSVDDSLLGSVIASEELTEATAKTLRQLLSPGKYFRLGQCIAYLYYSGAGENSGTFRGFSVNEIADADSELTHCMTGEPYESYDESLREMSDMGILSRLSNGSYRFRKVSFIKLIWPDEDAVLRTDNNV